jgi:hypothetical protein
VSLGWRPALPLDSRTTRSEIDISDPVSEGRLARRSRRCRPRLASGHSPFSAPPVAPRPTPGPDPTSSTVTRLNVEQFDRPLSNPPLCARHDDVTEPSRKPAGQPSARMRRFPTEVDESVAAPGGRAGHVANGDLDLVFRPASRASGSTMCRDISMPSTCTPARMSGNAIRPVPTANSARSRWPASWARNATVCSSSPRVSAAS